jgi:hypothetical protein
MNNSYLPKHPEEVTTQLFDTLPKRSKDVLEKRFGLGKNTKRMTLDAIGKGYGITRERVRQIEADGLLRIRKSDSYKELTPVFSSLEKFFTDNGGVLKESHALSTLAGSPKHENHIYFLLTLSGNFSRFHESDALHDRWTHKSSESIDTERVLKDAQNQLRTIGEPVAETKLYEILQSSAKTALGNALPNTVLKNWVGISKTIAQNYFNEWGLTEFPSIKPRGVRDLSHMVLNKHGKPLHFSDVASHIGKLIGKSVHVQTVHNELIKDNRFVLVGRGLYALKDWGYSEGMVKDVVASVLRENGPLQKNKIVEMVSKKRFVKPNTILINLENTKYFKKLSDDRYTTA